MSDELIAFVTCPPEKAEYIASEIVRERLAACVNVLSGITSIYTWEGAVNKEAEALLIIKTNRKFYDDFETKIKELHPYDVPEIICVPIERGSPDYLNWLNGSLGPKGEIVG